MAGRSAPRDPNYKLYGLYGGKDKYLAAKAARDKAKASALKSEKPYIEANKALDYELNNIATGLYTKLKQEQLQVTPDLAYIALLKDKISKAKAKISLNNTYIYMYDVKIRDAELAFEKAKVVKGTDSNGNGGGSDGGGDGKNTPHPGKGPFYFNAPLVAREQFVPSGSLPRMLPAGPIVGNAADFWAVTNNATAGGKGSIQMDRLTNTLELKANAKKASKDPKNFDPKMYGFKFHYNPTTVNMSWSGMMGANPVYEAAGLDPAVPMSTNLFTGTVSFDIILNRIQDIALLNPDGSFKYGTNPYGTLEISKEDRKTITDKGTMYDLEYLFRTLHGYASYTNFTASLMASKTNDPGWLPVRPVELHLGNKLRYRVRVSGLEVVHKIFSEKMVPLLSVVTITCMRYWDGPQDKKSLGAK